MTSLVPELADLPPRLSLDGELIAFGDDGLPSFPRLSERMLHGHQGIGVVYAIFDVLQWDGLATLNWPYRQRRELLEDLDLRGSHWDTAVAFEDGERYSGACETPGLEGVVAKKLSHRYRPGERLWGQGQEQGLLAVLARAASAFHSRRQVTIRTRCRNRKSVVPATVRMTDDCVTTACFSSLECPSPRPWSPRPDVVFRFDDSLN